MRKSVRWQFFSTIDSWNHHFLFVVFFFQLFPPICVVFNVQFYLIHVASQVTTRVNKPVDIPPPPVKKTRPLVPTARSRGVRLSVPWANGAICTPAPEEDVIVLEGEEEDDGAEVEVLEDRRDTESLYQQVCCVVV